MKLFNFILAVALFLAGCKINQKMSDSKTITLDTISVFGNSKPPIYNASKTRKIDLIHTKLDVKFDYSNQWLIGRANLTFRPYFYDLSQVTLDAKGFDIQKVEMVTKNGNISATYIYNDLTLLVNLEKNYTATDTLELYIDYIAKPNELKVGGSEAISSDKGLYFINPLGTEKKPQQIWTQGETEASSCWFPTVDSPNEKMTQEIYITVPQKYVTLSNGTLIFQTENADSTRTDYWRQDKPHSPYLAMMAVGDFAVVKDVWERDSTDVEVNYYVERLYEKYAKTIFGNTPEMLTFYSKLLGVPYPWDKYSQIVVRDYVSGAMENTSCVIHGEFMQRTDRELLDETNETIIAHELFHHWFGDLVTCESWANLPLNESFATYGEYLWDEHKYGKEEADLRLQGDLFAYLSESSTKQVDMIRFDYEDKEDMFDSHSYAKGGCILHMLRKVVGDEAFFKSLNVYLTRFAYKSAEIHDLRLVFEEITGHDLNWFFNQWFLNSGHPVLAISYDYDSVAQKQLVIVEQKQDLETTPLYQLPVKIDIYVNETVLRNEALIANEIDTFFFDVPSMPNLVNVDAEKTLLCRKTDVKPDESWLFQYYNAPLYLDRYEALKKCSNTANKNTEAGNVIFDALQDKFWNIRVLAIKNAIEIKDRFNDSLKATLIQMSENDQNTKVRVEAIRFLRKNYAKDSLLTVYQGAAEDLSYAVVTEGLGAISDINPQKAMELANTLEKEKNALLLSAIAELYAENGTDKQSTFFENGIHAVNGYQKVGFVMAYEKFLKNEKRSTAVVNKGIGLLEEIVLGTDIYYIKFYSLKSLSELKSEYEERVFSLNDRLKKLTSNDSEEVETLKVKLNEATSQKNKLEDMLVVLKEKEADNKLLKYIDN